MDRAESAALPDVKYQLATSVTFFDLTKLREDAPIICYVFIYYQKFNNLGVYVSEAMRVYICGFDDLATYLRKYENRL